jgi:Endonuclease-reverse transcriptase
MITETWLNERIPNSLLDPYCLYFIVRRDHPRDTTGGGVCAFIRRPIRVAIANSVSPHLELCGFNVYWNQSPIRFIVTYRPSYEQATSLVNCLQTLTETSLPCVIAGDLNCGHIDWLSLTAPSDGVQDVILKFVVSNGFAQTVCEPTRGENILDIILCNEPLSVFDTAVLPPFGCSDNKQVEFSFFAHICQTETADNHTTPIGPAYDWANADHDGMNQYLCSINWYDLLTTNLTADALWQSFKYTLQAAIDLNVPTRLVHKVPKAKVWYPSCIKRAVARKRRCWRQLKTNPHDSAVNTAYQAAADRHKKLTFKYELKREQKIIDCNNIGAFYKFINRKLSNKQGNGALHDQDGNIITRY